MKISVNEIKRLGYGSIVNLPIEDLSERIGAQLGAIEDIEDLGAKYQGVVVARVVSVNDHPDADRLHVCMIDDGGKVDGVERSSEGYVQVVCGAPNVSEGMLVAWLPPGSIVPETYHHESPFVLESRPLRGVVSNGMLASAKELALGDSHEGILEIDVDAAAGQPFADVYHLGDHIIDIENKMFTHRPDCFGLLGVAREIAGIQRLPFKSPDWYRQAGDLVNGRELRLKVDNQISDAVPRFMAVALRDVDIKPSPLWLQTALIRLGSRPINNVVDITNYVMLITGQPLHSYDYDKVGDQLGVRYGHSGEKLALLNGKEVEVTESDIVITDGSQPIGLGGVMGGQNTEVNDDTTRIILEVATFDMYSIRRTSMRHGLFTDAVTRFNKGQSSFQNDRVLAWAVGLLVELAGASIASEVQDIRANQLKPSPISVKAGYINDRLGLNLSANEMAELLENVEFEIAVDGDRLNILAPFWRTDVSIAEDVVEEIGRLYGFDHLPQVLPKRDIMPAKRNSAFELKSQIRSSLSRAGANELLTYSFVHEKLLSKANQDSKLAFRLSNALSPDLQYYRLSILPSLLDKVHANIKAGYDEFALFEMGKTHNVENYSQDGLPHEHNSVDLVYAATGKVAQTGAAYYRARRLLDGLASDIGLEFSYTPVIDEVDLAMIKPFDPRRSAYVGVKDSDVFLGIVGEFKPSVVKAFKLPSYTAGFSLDREQLEELSRGFSSFYSPLPRFPGTERDITFEADKAVSYARYQMEIDQAVANVDIEVRYSLTSIYQAENTNTKRTTFRFILTDLEKTITSEIANQVIDTIGSHVSHTLNARVI